MDDLYPRDDEHRFRLYAVVGDERDVLATAADMAAIGVAMGTIHEDMKAIGRRLCDYGRIGVLDTMPDGRPHPTGEWIVQPWDRRPA